VTLNDLERFNSSYFASYRRSSFQTTKMFGREGDSLYPKFWAKLTPFEQKRRFSIDIRS